MTDFLAWNELPVRVRRSRRLLYEYITGQLVLESPVNEPVDTPTTRNISFSINDGTDPVEGASVVIGETTKTTGSAGGCSFNEITDGEHNITVTAEGYTEYNDTITVSENSTSFTISLTAENTG